MDLGAKKEVFKGWMGLDGVGPAGGAVPSYASGRDPPEGTFLFSQSDTAEPGKGLAVFNRSAHSAGP